MPASPSDHIRNRFVAQSQPQPLAPLVQQSALSSNIININDNDNDNDNDNLAVEPAPTPGIVNRQKKPKPAQKPRSRNAGPKTGKAQQFAQFAKEMMMGGGGGGLGLGLGVGNGQALAQAQAQRGKGSGPNNNLRPFGRPVENTYVRDNKNNDIESVCGPMITQDESVDCFVMPSAAGEQCCCKAVALRGKGVPGNGNGPPPNGNRLFMNKMMNGLGGGHRRQLQEEEDDYDEIDDDVQCFPSVMIIGAQKSGTTVLLSYLLDHQQFTEPKYKEVRC